jgi:hypothetical protein
MKGVMSQKETIMPDLTSRRNRFHYLTAINLLTRLGISLRDIYIRAVGFYENYRGEIRSQDPEAGTTVTPETRITLGIGSNSAVDYMPYQFFYGLRGIRSTDNTWEENARSLMAPFDAAEIRYAAALQFQALKYELGITDTGHLFRFMELFEYEEVDESFSTNDIVLWASILPSLYQWSGNPRIVECVLSRLFKHDIQIKENVKTSTPIPERLRYRLGSKTARLGKETIIGRSFEESDSTYEIIINDVPVDGIRRLLPGGITRKRIEKLLLYCMPGDLDYRIRINVNRKAAKASANRYLGYSSYL